MNVNLSAVPNEQTAAVARAGASAVYCALHWGYFNARILSVRPDGSVDLEIYNANGTTMMILTRIKLKPSKAECGKGEAYLGSLFG